MQGTDYYGGIYISLVMATMFLGGLQAATVAYAVTAIARHLHNKMFTRLLRAPISFFDKNHSGNVLLVLKINSKLQSIF